MLASDKHSRLLQKFLNYGLKTLKHWPRLGVSDSDKQSSLILYGINYGRKKFSVKSSRPKRIYLFSSSVLPRHNKLERFSQPCFKARLTFASKARSLPIR
jgi:hypothetical protein